MKQLFNTIDKGALVVTVNRRLSRYLQQAFDADQLQRGHEVWSTPQIMPLSSWLHQLWQEYCFVESAPPRFIDQHQSSLLWQELIAESEQGSGLLNVASTARTVVQAWGLMQQWCLNIDELPRAYNQDVDAFRTWALAYQQRCQKDNFIDEASFYNYLTARLDQLQTVLPRHIVLFGFDEVTPQVQRLLDAINKAGSVVEIHERNHLKGNATRLACESVDEELRVIATWLKQLHEADQIGRTAVVVPKPAELRPRIEAIFDDVLQPANLLLPGSANIAPYDISLGTPLAEQPIIITALRLLELARGSMELAAFGRLLLSPTWAGGDDALLARAQFDAWLRKKSITKITLRKLCDYLARSEFQESCGELAQMIEKLTELYDRLPPKAVASVWAEHFKELLQTLAWGTGRRLESNEFQAVEAWKAVLNQFAGLEQVTGPFNYATALKHLRQLANNTVFQAQSRNQSIQVLGSLEAAGMQFDNLWLMGLSDDAWPTTASANPFLPITLQVEHGMPHASAERELAFAQRMTAGFLSSAKNIQVSYCIRDGDRDLRPSPLIEMLPEIKITALLDQPLAATYREQIYRSSQLEKIPDQQAPLVAKADEVAGGTRILKDQAACPFRAFAKYRLGARALDEASTMLEASDRGNLVHEVLEGLWSNLRNQKNLLALDETQRQVLISEVVTAVIEKASHFSPSLFSERFTALELERLQQMSLDWLALEEQRSPFEVIEIEQAESFEIAGLKMNVRVDRVDRLASGEQCVIDYKTGQGSSIAKWFDARPEEPQLPLYCVARAEPVSALAFAQVNVREYKFIGLSDELDIIKGIEPFSKPKYNMGKPDWPALIAEWQTVLENLAQAFIAGQADVDPKKYPTSCDYCDLTPLCRINEIAASGGEDE